MLGGYFSAGTIAVAAATGQKAVDAGTRILWFGVPMAVIMMLSQVPIIKWREGSNIRRLMERYYNTGGERHRLEVDLALAREHDYEHNEKLISTVALWVVFEFLLACAGVGLTIDVLLS